MLSMNLVMRYALPYILYSLTSWFSVTHMTQPRYQPWTSKKTFDSNNYDLPLSPALDLTLYLIIGWEIAALTQLHFSHLLHFVMFIVALLEVGCLLPCKHFSCHKTTLSAQ